MEDDIDPCECVWNHELAMRRLISLLRQGQTYCTDGECLDPISGLPQQATGNSLLPVFILMTVAVTMYAYVFRPRRAQVQDSAAKPRPANFEDRDDTPPTPPRT